jgi:high-affinity iron transporter
MVAAFVIFLREGIEASMIVAILLSALDRMGQRRHFRDVITGVAGALALVLAGGVTAYLTIKTYAGSRTQTIFETATYLLAAAALTYMTFWMRRHAPRLSAELRAKTQAALDGRARWGLRLLAFQAVGREGLETMVFTLAIVFASSGRGVIAGGIGGLLVALAIAFAIYHFGKRLNVSVFFTAVGALLMVFAAGILVDAVENLQQLGWLPVLTHPLWNTSHTLSENSTLGDIFHSFFGYSDQPTVAQALVYLGYLTIAVPAFVGLGRWRRSARPAAAEDAAASVLGQPVSGQTVSAQPVSAQPVSAQTVSAQPESETRRQQAPIA